MMRSLWKFFIGFGLAALAAALFLHPPLNSQDWAAWIGAIGTVGTLIGTLWLAARERSERLRMQSTMLFLSADTILMAMQRNLDVLQRLMAAINSAGSNPYLHAHDASRRMHLYLEILEGFQPLSKQEVIDLATISRVAAFKCNQAAMLITQMKDMYKRFSDFDIFARRSNESAAAVEGSAFVAHIQTLMEEAIKRAQADLMTVSEKA